MENQTISGFIINANDVHFSKDISFAVDKDAKNRSHVNFKNKSITWSVDIDKNSEAYKVLKRISESLNNIYEWTKYKRAIIFFRKR